MSFSINHTATTDFQDQFPSGGAGVVTAIYARVSESDGGVEQSIEDQIRQCRAYAAAHGATVHPDYIIEDTNEDSQDLERPGFKRILAAGQRGEVHAVIFNLQERLARGGRIFAATYLLELATIVPCCIDEPLNRGLVDMGLRAMISGGARESTKKAVKRGRTSRLADGKLLTGCRPKYGYAWKSIGDKKGQRKTAYVIDRDDPDAMERAAVVQRIFEGIYGGMTLKGIARTLQAEGIPTPNGAKEWTYQSVSEIAHWPGYAGAHRALGDKMSVKVLGKRTMKGWKRVPRPEGEAVDLPDAVEPLVSRELFDAVQARLAKNKAASPRRLQNPGAFLCYGRVVCGVCGNAVAHTNKKQGEKGERHPTYLIERRPDSHRDCENATTIRAAMLDELAWADVAAVLSSRERVRELLAEMRRADPTEETRARLTRDIAALGRQQEALMDELATMQAVSARRRASERINALGQQEDALSEELGRQEAQHAAWAASLGRADALEDALARIGAKIGDPRRVTPELRRAVVELMTVEVELYREGKVRYEDGTPMRHRTTMIVSPELSFDTTTIPGYYIKTNIAGIRLPLPRAA